MLLRMTSINIVKCHRTETNNCVTELKITPINTVFMTEADSGALLRILSINTAFYQKRSTVLLRITSTNTGMLKTKTIKT